MLSENNLKNTWLSFFGFTLLTFLSGCRIDINLSGIVPGPQVPYGPSLPDQTFGSGNLVIDDSSTYPMPSGQLQVQIGPCELPRVLISNPYQTLNLQINSLPQLNVPYPLPLSKTNSKLFQFSVGGVGTDMESKSITGGSVVFYSLPENMMSSGYLSLSFEVTFSDETLLKGTITANLSQPQSLDANSCEELTRLKAAVTTQLQLVNSCQQDTDCEAYGYSLNNSCRSLIVNRNANLDSLQQAVQAYNKAIPQRYGFSCAMIYLPIQCVQNVCSGG
jgi:hypothetical protein